MDRDLQVLKSGHILARISFNYESETSAMAHVFVNNIIDLGDGITTLIPLYKVSREISHDALSSITEIKSFDLSFFSELPDIKEQLDETVGYTYLPVCYRYLVGDFGIANIRADFSENRKELEFISTRGMHGDHQLPSNGLETNVGLLKRLCESANLGCADANFELVDQKS
jgi:hypothetical protein